MQNKKLSPRSEKLLMKYFDGECGRLESLWASWIAKKNPSSEDFKSDLEACSSATRSMYSSAGKEEIDLWNGIYREIAKAERLGVEKSPGALESLGVWFSRLGWGVSGALVTASVGVIMLRSGISPVPGVSSDVNARYLSSQSPSNAQSSSLSLAASNLPSESAPVTNASFGAPTAIPLRRGLGFGGNDPGVEIDWLRSSGHLRLIQDPSQRSTILWVQRNRSLNQARKPLQIDRSQILSSEAAQ